MGSAVYFPGTEPAVPTRAPREARRLAEVAPAGVTPAEVTRVEVTRAEREFQAASAACTAAEEARTRAETARDVAEAARDVARSDAERLEERVAFLDEQLQGARAYHVEVVVAQLAALHAECDLLRREREALHQELDTLTEELHGR